MLACCGRVAANSYQRAKTEPPSSGEHVLVNCVCGRGNTNAWVVADRRARKGAVAQRAPRRGAPPSRVEQLAHAPAIVDVSDGVPERDAFGQRCKALTGLGDGWVLALHLGRLKADPGSYARAAEVAGVTRRRDRVVVVGRRCG